MKIALDTLGCKLNQAETELFARQLAEAGHRLVSLVDEADVYILNTCTVTHTADSKSRHWLRQAHRRNPNALLVATGCYAQRVPQELAQIEGVSLVVGNDEKPYLLRLLQEASCLSCLTSIPEGSATNYHPAFKTRAFIQEGSATNYHPAFKTRAFIQEGSATNYHPAFKTRAFIQEGSATNYHHAFRTRAFIKIQDGCNSFCAYCIVPLMRGREHSLPVEQVVVEVRHRVVDGYKEVVLTGTEIGSYNYHDVSLKGLLENILAATDVTRLRLSSLQPQEICPELIGLWRDNRLCPHFHLSLQSGSDDVLRRMKRGYSVSDYQETVSLIRALVPNVAITTDIIVGFPGETEQEFEESYNFCQQMAFARIHVFAYSRRSGTQAAQFPNQISPPLKKERSQPMLALARESARNFRQQFLGKVMPVLWEKQNNGLWSGLTDNYIKVYTRSDEDLTNKLLPVKLGGIWKDGVWGEVV